MFLRRIEDTGSVQPKSSFDLLVNRYKQKTYIFFYYKMYPVYFLELGSSNSVIESKCRCDLRFIQARVFKFVGLQFFSIGLFCQSLNLYVYKK